MNPDCVYADKYFEVISPAMPQNCAHDGGHLTMNKKSPVTDRAEMTAAEAIDFIRISMAVGKAMYEVLGVERVNYCDLGNWGIDDPGGSKMHLHFLGRAREQKYQKRLHHIVFYPKGDPIYDDDSLKRLAAETIAKLRTRIAEILGEDKYVKMAQLAGVE